MGIGHEGVSPQSTTTQPEQFALEQNIERKIELPDKILFKWGGKRGADHGSNKVIRQAIKMAGKKYQWLLEPKMLEEEGILESYFIRSPASSDPRSLQYQELELIPGKDYILCLV